MGKIRWDTKVNAPCCPGQIVGPDRRTILIQTDWDYPGVASSFGWSVRDVQSADDGGESVGEFCNHDGTDGTVDCAECGVTAREFISAARDYLAGHDGAKADDPGYFV